MGWNKTIWALVAGILVVGSGALAAAQGPSAENTRTAGSNLFTDNQVTHGNWEPTKFVEAGWSGYRVTTRMTKVRPTISYKSGDTTHYIHQCPDGDCQYQQATVFQRIGENGFDTARFPVGVPVGGVSAFDNGSVEKSELLTPSNVAISRIDEVEAQSRLGFEEAQVQTFTGFNQLGTPRPLGHIEEADAPHMVNQPESVYRRGRDGKDEFLTTVVERIGYENNGVESFRMSTAWCNSDAMRVTESSVLRIFQNDSFDWSACPLRDRPIFSDTGAGLKQAFTGRSASSVSVQNPMSAEHDLAFTTDSDVSILWGNGTEYMVDYERPREGNPNRTDTVRAVHINSEVYQSMANQPRSPVLGKENQPKVKYVTVNWDSERGFEGVAEDDWLSTPGSAVALLAFEKTGEIYTDASGTFCAPADGWAGGHVRCDGNGNCNELPSMDAKEYALACKSATSYNLTYHIMFPPQINGRELTNYEKAQLLDRILALMPDQTQQSPELATGEEYLDQIMALELFHAAQDPSVLDINHLVDIGTEEDHTTAQLKIRDFFSDIGVIGPRADRVPDGLPAPGPRPDAEGAADAEIEF